MNVYVAVGWGPGGEDDEILIVRAADLLEAAALADEALSMRPGRCGWVKNLFLAGTGVAEQTSGVVAGPLSGQGFNRLEGPSWVRRSPEESWSAI